MTAVEQQEDKEISRTVALLGGKRVLSCVVHTRLDAHDVLQVGLPSKAVEHLVKQLVLFRIDHHGLVKALGISRRTYQRHQEDPSKRLSPEQSGRAWKFAEVLARATEIFGSQEEAEAWLERPAMALDHRMPIDLLSTPAGAESVEQHLTRLEYGVYT